MKTANMLTEIENTARSNHFTPEEIQDMTQSTEAL
jgi:hypothetical protein